jgi:hypothetical protein
MLRAMLLALVCLALVVVGLSVAVWRLARQQRWTREAVGRLGLEVDAVGATLDEASATLTAAVNALGHVAPKPVDELAQRRTDTASRLKAQFPNLSSTQLDAAADQILAAAPAPRTQTGLWPKSG